MMITDEQFKQHHQDFTDKKISFVEFNRYLRIYFSKIDVDYCKGRKKIKEQEFCFKDIIKFRDAMNNSKFDLLLLTGTPGTGKSYISYGLGVYALMEFDNALSVTKKTMDQVFKDRSDNYNNFVFYDSDLLIIDDFGISENEADLKLERYFLNTSISRAYDDNKKIIINTNRNIEELKEYYLSDRSLSRLNETQKIKINLEGFDLRTDEMKFKYKLER